VVPAFSSFWNFFVSSLVLLKSADSSAYDTTGIAGVAKMVLVNWICLLASYYYALNNSARGADCQSCPRGLRGTERGREAYCTFCLYHMVAGYGTDGLAASFLLKYRMAARRRCQAVFLESHHETKSSAPATR